jgi:hypothetical protein
MNRKPSTEDELAIYTNPTHLGRASAFLVLGAWTACAALAGYSFVLWHISYWITVPPLIPIGIAALSTEPATDVGAVGLYATWLRGRLGQRAAHEWLMVRAHYFVLSEWPLWRSRCEAFYRLCQAPTRRFPMRRLGSTRR